MVKQRKNESLDIWMYSIFALRALRILLVFIPQNGYIHPDEYFQSVEVFAGRIFDVEHSPPWEFNTTLPIRGITMPYFTTGLCFIFLRDISRLAIEYLSLNVVTPYFLLVIPRLLITVLSFIVDYSLQKICISNNENYKSRQIILGTSYVMLVYATRTFSNTLELILFAVLLYFVSESQTFSNELVRKQEYIKYRYEKSVTVAEKAKFHKLKLYLVSDNYRNCWVISTITVFGIFNRPTFIAFAIIPVFFWIYRGVGQKRVSVTQFHTRILFFAICGVPAVIFNVIIDSFYYGYITWGEIGMLDISINSFVMTPLNFIKYNVQSSNLAKHGLHPRFLHLLVNLPLLFNALGCMALYTIGKYIYWAIRKRYHHLPSIRSIKMLMTMSFLSPVLILSIFPHQEPRFLIPVLFPLVYLHSEKILPESIKTLIKVPEASIQEKKNDVKFSYNILLRIWIALNVLLLIFYGFIHQGGVYLAVNYLYKDIKFTSMNTEFHIVTSSIYSLPESFLIQKTSNKLFSRNQIKYSVKKRVFLYEEGSKDLIFILKIVQALVKAEENQRNHFKHYKNYKIYLLISSSRGEEAENLLQKNSISTQRLDSFWPHLSIEAFPDLTRYCFNPTFIFYKNCKVLPFWEYVQKIRDLCELTLYEINYRVEAHVVNSS